MNWREQFNSVKQMKSRAMFLLLILHLARWAGNCTDRFDRWCSTRHQLYRLQHLPERGEAISFIRIASAEIPPGIRTEENIAYKHDGMRDLNLGLPSG